MMLRPSFSLLSVNTLIVHPIDLGYQDYTCFAGPFATLLKAIANTQNAIIRVVIYQTFQLDESTRGDNPCVSMLCDSLMAFNKLKFVDFINMIDSRWQKDLTVFRGAGEFKGLMDRSEDAHDDQD